MVVSLRKWLAILPVLLVCTYGFRAPEVMGRNEEHPFYVSVTELNHNQQENILEISCKMFADDFETTIKTQYKTTIDISHPRDTLQAEKLVSDYIQKHLQLKVNGKALSLQFLGYEKESESVWCYLQVSGMSQVKKLEITNRLLYEIDKTQMGIVHAVVGGVRKSTRLVNPEAVAMFEW